jgi:hypothetical protein
MSKRSPIDVIALTTEKAAPMPEAAQRMPVAGDANTISDIRLTPARGQTENLEALAFKVPPVFRKRFRQRAVAADPKLNELLFEALAAWEEKSGLKS